MAATGQKKARDVRVLDAALTLAQIQEMIKELPIYDLAAPETRVVLASLATGAEKARKDVLTLLA